MSNTAIINELFPEQQIQEFKDTFDRDGYLVLPSLIPKLISKGADIPSPDDLKTHVHELIDHFFKEEFKNMNASIFSTQDQAKKTDEYFVGSGDKIRYFFEEDAMDSKGNLQVDQSKAINKIGHALHDQDHLFRKFSYHPELARLAKVLALGDLVTVQSMYIFKQPHIGGFVSPHQDSTFLNTKPLSCVAFWVAMEDVTMENGCMWAVPGSHKSGIVQRFILSPDDPNAVKFVPAESYEAAPWKSLVEEFDKSKHPEKWKPLTCPAGSLVVLHGSVVHMSDKNTSDKSRHAYTFHMVDRNAHYSENNWLHRAQDKPFTGFSDHVKL